MTTLVIPQITSATIVGTTGGGVDGDTLDVQMTDILAAGWRDYPSPFNVRVRIYQSGDIVREYILPYYWSGGPARPAPFVFFVQSFQMVITGAFEPGSYQIEISTAYDSGPPPPGALYWYQGTSNRKSFTINAPATVSSASVSQGSAGTTFTLSGDHFKYTNASGVSTDGVIAVKFASSYAEAAAGGGIAAAFTTASDNSITVVAPAGLTPTVIYALAVTARYRSPGLTYAGYRIPAILSGAFLYNTPAAITSLTPGKSLRLTATPIVIVGTNFSSPLTVTINGVACTSVVVTSTTQIDCITPSSLDVGLYTLAIATATNGIVSTTFRYVYPLNGYGTALVLQFPKPGELPAAPTPATSVQIEAVAVSTTTGSNYSSPSGRSVDTYDASGVGGGWTKDHYNQIHEGVRRIKASFDAQHAEGDGSSQITVRGMRGVLTASETVHVQPPVGTPVVVEIAEHGGEHYSGFHVLQNPTDAQGDDLDAGGLGIASLRFAFDDTKIYGVVTLVAKCHGRTNDYFARYNAYMFVPSNPVLATVAAMDLENHARRGYSIADGLYLQLLDCLEKLLALYTAEHDIVTGEHQVSLERFSGFQRLTMDVRAPTGIGGFQSYVIGSRRDRRTYFSPSLVGEPGCGIAVASIGYDQDSVLLLISRLETGDTDEFEASICSVTND